MLDISGAYKHGKYEKRWKSFGVMSTMKVFAMQDGQMANHPAEQIDKHNW